jgi:predicted dehydrogenase
MPERIPGYAEQLRAYGVELVARPEDLLGKIDAVMIESQQGARHLERARPFLEAGMPTFIDKPFAATVEEGAEIIALAERHKAPLLSCSALRFDARVQEAVRRQEEYGPLLSADVWSSASLHAGNPGLLHYGIHGVEILYTLLGAGCARVQDLSTEQGEVATGLWPSGHAGTLRGLRAGQGGFGFAAHYERGHFVAEIEGASFYSALLRAIVGMFESGQAPVDARETLEIIAFIEAAQRSAAAGGVPVDVTT